MSESCGEYPGTFAFKFDNYIRINNRVLVEITVPEVAVVGSLQLNIPCDCRVLLNGRLLVRELCKSLGHSLGQNAPL